MAANGLALTKLELRDRLAGARHLRLLAGDRGEIRDGTVDDLRVTCGVADTHVHHDLREAGDEHRVGVVELALERILDFFAVLGLKARGGRLGHQMSFPVRFE